MTFHQDEISDTSAIKKERLITALFLLVVTTFIFFDIFDDWYEGIPTYHILFEILTGLVGIGLASYLFSQFARQRRIIITKTRDELLSAKRAAQEWQQKASNFREGLTNAIVSQFEEWGLTESEKDICFLLLKGFTLQEIADLRKTTERTVRQQSSTIYRKCSLSGRVQLSAFFLEDLLGPTTGQ